MLIFEALDSISVGSLEKEADHRVIEATVDEIVDDGSQFRLSAEPFEVAHSPMTLLHCRAGIKLCPRCAKGSPAFAETVAAKKNAQKRDSFR